MRIPLLFVCAALIAPPAMRAQDSCVLIPDPVAWTGGSSLLEDNASMESQTPLVSTGGLGLTPPFDEEMHVALASFGQDTVHPAPARRLLPDNMSFMEKGLWGENGFVRNIGIASALTPDVRKHELGVRRTMLTMHQIGGFVTLGLMITTVYWGQKTLDYRTSLHNDPTLRSYRNYHQGFVTATIISYGLTGGLAILSPPPLIRRDETSTTTIHKTLAWVHFVGMVLTPIIGASLHHSMNYDQLSRFHQVSGYVTTAALAASMIVITL